MTTQGIHRSRATTPAQGRWRVLRGLVLAVAALLVPTAAHVSAGGAVPVDIGFFVVAAGVAGASVALADRRRGVAEIGAVVMLVQPFMHATLSWSGHHDVTTGGATMAGAHVAAGLVVTVLVAGAERLLWAWWALWTTVLWSTTMWADMRRILAAIAFDVPRRICGQAFLDSATPPASVVLITAPRRGPPHARMA